MLIALLGASSQIAKDLVLSFAKHTEHDLILFSRRCATVELWLASNALQGRYSVADYAGFGDGVTYGSILNFVGVGNPAQAAAMGATIFDVTLQYDEMALDYIRQKPQCRYLFMSSGAAYGSSFDKPVESSTKAAVRINHLQPQDWYAIAKLHAECRHRSLNPLPIIDIRVFNYFSRTQDMSACFFITEIVRAICNKSLLKTTSDYIVRDFLHPADFYQLVDALLSAPAENAVVDCYSRAPVSKPDLLQTMHDEFGLRYEISEDSSVVNATGKKPYYYSLNTRAADFGYQPALTSLEGILREVEAYLQHTARGEASC